ncbi:ankyrin repeat-containing domain protein [Ephemerocybe angulata]|uniref:Ankyrin repeat-containing domain protein n=1 Tax=Ephemerocybe angulata TaxID=980116 RepID=A0A8H6IGP5_9AGAR|nr:ankyrin repeat-containing domain protein [Tulosesus angulatus]
MRDTANNCAAEHALISILGSHVPFASGALRIASFVIYGLFLVPGLNLLLPIVVFLGFHYCARGSPPDIMPEAERLWLMSSWRKTLIHLVQAFIVRWWSMIPPVLGLLFLLAINLVFIIDIELTLKQNAHLQDPDEAKWGFGQILAILLLFMPLRDLAETLITRKVQREVNLGFKNAVKQHDWDTVFNYVARGADLHIAIEEGSTAIQTVCRLSPTQSPDSLLAIRRLLEAGSDPNIKSDPKRDTGIIRRENAGCLQLLRDYDNSHLDGGLVLRDMAHKGYGAGVRLLLAAPEINVNAPDTCQRTPLIFAAEKGHEAVVKLLLAAPGIDVNAADNNGRTPLSFAAGNGHEAVVKLLLASPEIDVNAPDTNGRTPLSFAAGNGHEAVVKLLLAAPGIDVNAPSTGGWAPLKFTAYNGHEAIVKLLLATPGIDVNAPDADGWTPLITAVWKDESRVVKLLLAAPGIDINGADTSAWTALTWAAFTGKEDIVQDLCAVPEIIVDVADVKQRLENPPKGWYPASKEEQEKCLRILEEFVDSKGGGVQDGSEGGEPSGGRWDDP